MLDVQKTDRTPTKRLVALGALLSLGFLVISGLAIWDVAKRDYEAARVSSTNLATTLASDISRTIDSLDLSLRAVGENLKLPGVEQLDPELRTALLFDRSTDLVDYGSVIVLDRNGRVRYESRSTLPGDVNLAGRPYFEYHRTHTDNKLVISEPYTTYAGTNVIALSRRLTSDRGEFDGVVVGSIRLTYFRTMFKKLSLGDDDVVTLLRPEGVIVMRLPFADENIGRRIPNARVVREFVKAPSGSFEDNAMIDGVRRLYSYQQVDHRPLVISVGRSVDRIYTNWRGQAIVVGTVLLALCAFNMTLILFLTRTLRNHATAKRALQSLATTDALTGLANRRHFDAVLDKEWARLRRAQQPIALLMIDADHFKNFNDTFGHQAGDEALAAIADILGASTRRVADLGARYGGEEFAVILPGDDAAGALTVAEDIRARITRLRAQQGDRPDRTPTVSIGVAALIPQPGLTASDLIKAADEALYRAKQAGRDCIMTNGSVVKLVLGQVAA